MSSDLFNAAVRIVYSWRPKKRYPREEGYRDELYEFLRERLPRRRPEVVKEAGRHLCDIGVGRVVGIELKRNLHGKTRVDRLKGQLDGFLGDYSNLIVVLVGETDSSAHERLISCVKRMSSRAKRIEVVDKGGGVVKKRRRKGKKRRRKGKKRRRKGKKPASVSEVLDDVTRDIFRH